jgi:hypothetical protein
LYHDAEIRASGAHGGGSAEKRDVENAGLALKLDLAAVGLSE